MGLLSKSLNITRYHVKKNLFPGGQVDADLGFWDSVEAGVKSGAYRKATNTGPNIGGGWTHFDDFMKTEFEGSDYVFGRYVVLGLREDTVRIPARLIEMEIRNREKEILATTGQNRLTSGQRRELKEAVKERLYKEPWPAVSIRVDDLVWDTDSGIVYFLGTSVKAHEFCEAWFKKCFGLSLIPMVPGIRKAELSGQKIEDILEKRDFLSILDEGSNTGRDFLKWLWFEADVGTGTILTANGDKLGVCLGDKIVLVSDDESSKDRVAVNGESSEHREGLAALRENKRVEEIRLGFMDGKDDFWLTLNGPWFNMKSVRFQAIAYKMEDEDPSTEGDVLIRMDQIERAFGMLDSLFAEYLRLTKAPEWGEVQAKMTEWIEGA